MTQDDTTPQRLTEPPAISPIENAIENCEFMIEESIADRIAISEGERPKNRSFQGQDYDDGYAQGRKDACRVILLVLRGREHITSDDVLGEDT